MQEFYDAIKRLGELRDESGELTILVERYITKGTTIELNNGVIMISDDDRDSRYFGTRLSTMITPKGKEIKKGLFFHHTSYHTITKIIQPEKIVPSYYEPKDAGYYVQPIVRAKAKLETEAKLKEDIRKLKEELAMARKCYGLLKQLKGLLENYKDE